MAFPSLGGTGVLVDNETSSSNMDTPADVNQSSPAEEHQPHDSDGPVPFIDITQPPCQWILYSEINNSG